MSSWIGLGCKSADPLKALAESIDQRIGAKRLFERRGPKESARFRTSRLTFWSESFPDRKPDHAVFPTERVGAGGDAFTPCVADTDPETPIRSLKEAWESAKSKRR